MSEWPCARILVLGDSGVGKTTFCSLVCTDLREKVSKYTVGCRCHVLYHEISGSSWMMELLDVGGAGKYRNARSVLYNAFDGVILVYDLSNMRSYDNARHWLEEATGDTKFSFSPASDASTECSHHLHVRTSAGASYPVLIVGNKADVTVTHNTRGHSHDALRNDTIFTSAAAKGNIAPGSPARAKLHAFFENVKNARTSGVRRHQANFDAL